MKKLSKAISLSLVAALLMGVLAACGGGNGSRDEAPEAGGENVGSSDITGDITFWTQDTSTWAAYFDKAIAAFMDEYPGINVTVEYFPEFAQKASQAFAAGQEPDVIQTWQSVTEWANAGKLAPVPDTVFTEAELGELFYEAALMNKMHDGQYYNIPAEINVESPQLFVNMDILAEENIELPEGWVENNGPATFAELIEFADLLTVKSGDVVSRSGLAYCYAQFEANFVSLIWQNGGDYRDAENMAVKFQTPEAQAAAETILKYANGPDAVSDNGQNRYDVFTQGTAAMCVGAPWYAGSFEIDAPGMNWQVFNMPAWVEGSDPISMATGGWGYSVSNKCENKDAAWTLVKWLCSAEQIGDWAYTTGAIPARVDSLADLTYDPEVGSVDKALVIVKDILPYAQEDGAYMMTPSTLIYTIVREQLRNLLDTGDIETALRVMEEEGNRMIEENFSR